MFTQKKINRKIENIRALLKYPRISKLLKEHDLFFFFPFWQYGGGERVHSDILNVFRDVPCVCFLTDKSVNDAYKAEFQAASETMEIGRWAFKGSFKELMLKKMANELNRKKHPVVFGCHSPFFYSLLPLLDGHVKTVDLTHAFTFDPQGAENYSLPYVKHLKKRVILGENAKNDYREQYQKNNLPLEYLNRLVIIPNKVKIPDSETVKAFNFPLNVLFVSRNADEKRPELFVKIANESFHRQLPFHFQMIGDFLSYRDQVKSNTSLIGPIYEREQLNSYYKAAHIILITSWREGFPMVILEGMCYGVVPISTAVGEIPSYIRPEHKNGFLIPNDLNDEKIVEGFIKTLTEISTDIGELKECNKNCYSYVKENFNEDKFSKSYKELLLD
ncbi:MAG: glycosyltransferase family 4 protein [Sphingobacteriaceae bacterium]|nr:glycosyltransferase family 4 protein [Sphingobacteriaceae bacterium]